MGRDPVELVCMLFAGTAAERPEDLCALLADDVVINGSCGQIFVGIDGFAQWCAEQRTRGDLGPEGRTFEDLGNGWVLAEARAGCWLTRVRDGRISATLYYRTANEARKAVRV